MVPSVVWPGVSMSSTEKVGCSLRAMAAINMVKIGVVEVMMEVSRGVVNLLDSR